MKNLLPKLSSRHDYFDYLDRWTVGTVDDLRDSRTARTLVKAFLLEASHSNEGRDTIAALAAADQGTTEVDETLVGLRWPNEEEDWALVDIEDDRYPVVYTGLESIYARSRIEEMTRKSALLDRSWFAAPVFRHMWDVINESYPEYRFSRMVFEYEDVYETNPYASTNEDNSKEVDDNKIERRRARMQISERIGKLRNALEGMRSVYTPLESIVRLGVPAPHRGSIDVYHNGQFTNRSDSIDALSQTVGWMMNLYKTSTELVEEMAWSRRNDTNENTSVTLGAPLLVLFDETLEAGTFNKWITSLGHKNNRFRLWGRPINRGDDTIHFYAVDNHLWQTIDLEISRKHLYAILPTGTCGNTIHRIVTNIQRFIDPRPKVFIGERPYEEVIRGGKAQV